MGLAQVARFVPWAVAETPDDASQHASSNSDLTDDSEASSWSHVSSLNLANKSRGPWFTARYQWDGTYYPCQIVSDEAVDGTFTIKFDWGCLQMSTPRSNIDWKELVNYVPSAAPVSSSAVVATEVSDNLYLAARRGDVVAVKEMLYRSTFDVNTPVEDRTPLYWACLTGHEEIVRVLLLHGAVDVDDAAAQATTCAQPVRAAADDRDLLFDPDNELLTDNVERHSTSAAKTDGDDAVSRRIRALLLAAKADYVRCSICEDDGPLRAMAVPCGHSQACVQCLTKIYRNRDPCPFCRQRICEVQVYKPAYVELVHAFHSA